MSINKHIELKSKLENPNLFDRERAKSYSRGKVLEQIQEASSWCPNGLPLEHIQAQMSWLKENLKLETINLSSEEICYFSFTIQTHWISRVKEERLLSGRQDTCYLSCMRYINEDSPGEAYHELHDFIDDYGRKGEFISDLELRGIKQMVEAMDSKIEELGKGQSE